jgi:hypothetical protein
MATVHPATGSALLAGAPWRSKNRREAIDSRRRLDHLRFAGFDGNS